MIGQDETPEHLWRDDNAFLFTVLIVRYEARDQGLDVILEKYKLLLVRSVGAGTQREDSDTWNR